MQKVKHSDVQISVEKEASKHAVLHRKALWDWMAASSQHAVVTLWIGMASFNEMIMVGCGENGMRRMGVG